MRDCCCRCSLNIQRWRGWRRRSLSARLVLRIQESWPVCWPSWTASRKPRLHNSSVVDASIGCRRMFPRQIEGTDMKPTERTLQRGDLVEVRSAAEILGTLDKDG